MAGNLVKWWKHKILGGYKQFSVQECTTDSEELMYHQVRASSSCSAPPDLLLVSDRENNIPLRSPVVNIIAATAASATAPTTTTTSPSSGINACHLTSATNNNQHRHNQQKLQYHHHQQQQQHQQQQHHQVTTQQLSLAYNNSTKDIISSGGVAAGKHQKQSGGINNGSGSSSGTKQHGGSHQQDMQQPLTISHDIVDGQIETQQQINNHSSIKQQQQHAHHNQQTQQQQSQQQQHQQPHHNHHQQRPEEHIRLEEFTCDVSVEGGKSSQPLQFSFTFYDLDGHHGKITKDDIVGIVYTIYESIGKSVVVPHSGSKTINVRLTVSPEGKTKSTKNKKALDHNLHPTLLNNSSSHQKASALASNSQAATRRLHRYRPRKLIKSDEEDDDSNSDKERMALKANTKAQKLNNKLKAEQSCCTQQQQQQLPSTIMSQQTAVATDLPNSPLDTIYANLNASSPPETCRECLAAADEARNTSISPLVSAATTTTKTLQFPIASKTSTTTNEAYMKHVASTRIKMLRKSRKQKHQDCLDTRQRSLSVGNETCWKNRHLQPKHHNQQQLLWQAEQQLNHSVGVGGGGSDIVVDGVQLRNPLKNGKSMMTAARTEAQKRNSAECWKTALNRNDLISIIRESMEKNRLCFQLNGKPQANVSPIRQSPSTTTNNNNNSSSSHQQQLKSVTKHSQANAQRQRSNTVSKIPTLIANHNNAAHHLVSPQHHQRSSSCANTISSYNNNNNNSSQQQQHDLVGLHEPHNIINSSSNSNNIHHQHLQPHIPIYHQQMAINPAVIAAQNALLTATAPTSGGVGNIGYHSKTNLCGYDSFLHATICGGGGGLSHSPPPPPALPVLPQASTNHTSLNTQLTTSHSASNISGGHHHHHHHHQQQQQIATVQPIISSNSLTASVQPNQIKTSKILRSGSYTQSDTKTTTAHHAIANTTQNSPQYHGYQRLPSSSKHNLSALHLLSPNTEKPSLGELDKWRRDQVKNYDQLLYAKLSEKLQQTNLVSANNSHQRESNQKRKQRLMRQRRAHALVQQEAHNVALASTICLREDTDYATMLPPIVGDPVECENLLGQTSDEETTHSQNENTTTTTTKDNVGSNCKQQDKQQVRHVAEGTLVVLDDNNEPVTNPKAKVSSNLDVDTLLSVENNAEVHNLQSLVDDLDIDEDFEENPDEELEEELTVETESGCNIAADSQNSSNANVANAATLVNTNAHNSGANISASSNSLIHRYVHEHIHHHYHHFEEKEE